MIDTVEKRTAEAILELGKEVRIGDEIFMVAPPSVATMILVSEAIAELKLEDKLDENNLLYECLNVAKHCRPLGDVMAILILGAKGLEVEVESKYLFGLIRRVKVVNKKKELSSKILNEFSAQKISNLLGKLLNGMDVGFFFATINSLIEINLMKTGKTKTTASGR